MTYNRLADGAIRFTFWAYALFVFGFFLVPKLPEHYEYYYLTLLPAAVLLLPYGYRRLQHSPLFWLVLTYLVYMSATSLWSSAVDAGQVLFGVRLGIYILSFVLLSVVLLDHNRQHFESMLKAACALAAIMAIVSALLFYSQYPFPAARLHGLFRMEYIIRSGYAWGFFAVLSLYFLFHEKNRALRIGYALTHGTLLIAVILTQSRAALAALLLAALILGFSRNRKLGFILFLLTTALLAALWLSLPELTTRFSIDAPYRPHIWMHWLTHTWETAPLFGHGLVTGRSPISAEIPYWEAHNAFIGSFRDGGSIGLGLLLALVGYAFVAAFRGAQRRRDDYLYPALLVYLLVCTLFNDDRLLIRPQELWLYFWLPVSFIIAHEIAETTPHPMAPP